jgi:hypothetical protein
VRRAERDQIAAPLADELIGMADAIRADLLLVIGELRANRR